MIERYVFIKLSDAHATDAGRAEVIAKTRDALAAIPGVQGVTVGAPADEASRASWDVSIAVRFARLEDVATYRDHPAHRAYVDEFLAPRAEVIKAWNFEV
ncbi:MAG: Dabb family protein [Deltaproteobacteria bacterium]|nr:MAG: Dabb family protein [Deltaproteobacteria bacterium]